MKNKLNYLNIGCGDKYHKDWVNIDMHSNNTDVISCNLLKGIPFPDEKFEIVYQSQVLEHFPKEKAFDFMKECYRVLKENGIIRVVVPDLENIVNEYQKNLNENIENPSKQAEANYDWIMLEMYDQTVRNYSGGQMAKFLQQDKIVNEQYVFNRSGHVGSSIRKSILSGTSESIIRRYKALGFFELLRKVLGYSKRKMMNIVLGKKYKIGDFRLGGEIHMWMYDKYSLSRLLRDVGFRDIKIKKISDSDIPNWNLYELEGKNVLEQDSSSSLFIEAKK